MDVARSYTFMLKEPGGLGKIIIGGLLLFVPIFGWAVVAGYTLRVLRNIAQGYENLPAWDNWGDLFIKGLLIWVGVFIWNIPGLILSRLGAGGTALSTLWIIFLFDVFPLAMIRYALSDNFGAFFEFRQIFTFIRENVNNWITAVIMAFVAQVIAMVGFILVVIGVVFTVFWAMLAAMHLYGTVWRTSAAAVAPSP